MAIANTSLITKGIFAVSIVAATAAVGVVGFAQADTVGGSGNGYGTTSEEALAAADTLEAGFDASSTEYDEAVSGLVLAASNSLTEGGAAKASDFQAKFDSANNSYDADMASALEMFRANVNAAKSTAESKDQFIDMFNRAKADYFNALEAAKNKFADDINRMGGNNNAQVKDAFMNEYNEAKGIYGTYLEKIKNDFAATLG